MYDLSQQTWPPTGSTPSAVADHRFLLWRPNPEHFSLSARDRLDPTAPFAISARPGLPLDSGETQYALHIGLEHRFNDVFSVFGRAARAFRTPNVDERVSSGPAFDPVLQSIPGNFTLKTQTSTTSKAVSASRPARSRCNPASTTWSSTNEIHFNPGGLFFNVNLDPTRRYGSETSASLPRQRHRAAARRFRLYPRGVPRRALCGQ
jgi:iron complex outermembrane receptor protein